MNPKEKAEDLVLRYSKINARHKDSIKCALIAVDEYVLWSDKNNLDYWQQVKQEIEKL